MTKQSLKKLEKETVNQLVKITRLREELDILQEDLTRFLIRLSIELKKHD